MDETTFTGEKTESQDPVKNKSQKQRNPVRLQHLKEEKERRQKKRARIIVRNLSFKITEEELRKYFEQWGKLVDVNLLKRPDGKLVGCAFLQYELVNEATKAILKGNNQELLGRPIFIDWALGKDQYKKKSNTVSDEPPEKRARAEIKEENIEGNESKTEEEGNDLKSEDDRDEEEKDDEKSSDDGGNEDVYSSEEPEKDDNDSNLDKKVKLDVGKIKKEKHISNDVQEGCTVFIKNVPFDATDSDLRKVCRKFGLIHYAIINREPISKHSKGTAFVKFKSKESADLCLQAGTEFVLMDEILDPHPALSREEMRNKAAEKTKKNVGKDSRNLYLAREGLIMSGSKAAEGVSASDMNKRHKLEQIKTQVLKNLNRFVSRNRLSIHNLPLNYDNENLREMVTAYTGFKPHECRVMRENKITPENPKGKSKGFGFMSFSTHQEALMALRKLNNNPQIFGTQHRPIVAFSIEDRAVHKIKEKRKERSKINNPTFKEKLAKRKGVERKQNTGNTSRVFQKDDKSKVKKKIEKLEQLREGKARAKVSQSNGNAIPQEDYVGTAAKPGASLSMRSIKKIKEQSQEHLKRVKNEKKKKKQQKIKQIHMAERKADVRPKQKRKIEKDDLMPLVKKYKFMLENRLNEDSNFPTTKKPKRTKWYTE